MVVLACATPTRKQASAEAAGAQIDNLWYVPAQKCDGTSLLPTLYLIPTPLGAAPLGWVLPEATRQVAAQLTHFVAERAKSARAFLKAVDAARPLSAIAIAELNEHTPVAELPGLLGPLRAGYDLGLLSEAGCPAVADPGAELVRLAHGEGFAVKPLVGPSAVLLALMASGLPAQRFSFHGYLPAKTAERAEVLRQLEARAEAEGGAQLFIEAPYRNQALLTAILALCRSDTWLTVACDLTTEREWIVTRPVAAWRDHSVPELNHRPALFLLWRAPHARSATFRPRTTRRSVS